MPSNEQRRNNILLVSGSDQFDAKVHKALPEKGLVFVDKKKTATLARRALLEKRYDLVVINAPLSDEMGYDLAMDIVEEYGSSVIIATPPEIYDSIWDYVADYGIMVILKPLDPDHISKGIRFLLATQDRMKQYVEKMQKLEDKIDEVKLDKRAQEYYLAGNSDPQAKPIVLSDLIFVFTEHRYTIPDPECSKFITCGSNGSKNIPFNKQSYADTFDDIINNHYSVALNRMKGFIDGHIDRSREKWLVKALVDVMERDDSIGDETILFINENGSSVQKKALDSIDDYCLDSLVLGVLHYIVVHRNGMNKQGATAFKENSCKENNEHKYNGSFGSSLGKRIKTHPLDEKYTASEAKDDYEAEIVTEIESTVSDDEATMADDVFEGASYADPTSNGVPQPNITYIQNQTNIGKCIRDRT